MSGRARHGREEGGHRAAFPAAAVAVAFYSEVVTSAPFRACARILAALACLGLQPACADEAPTPSLDAELEQQVRRLAHDGSTLQARPGARVEVEVGALDARLRLSPCQKIEPYLPANARPWGRTRIGLKCAVGPVPWNVYLPLTVKVWARGWAAARALAAGTVLSASDLVDAEVDLAEQPGAVLGPDEIQAAVGRTLARPLNAGQGVRGGDLKPRLWFAAGDSVKIRAVGAGYAIEGEGQALSPGIEGQPARVRIEGGRVVTGVAAAERRIDVAL